jgi:uncharacterized protein (DUF1015 family)
MRGDCVEQLGAGVGVERARALLDQADAEMHVAEQASLGGLAEARAGLELGGAADVVEECGGEEQVGAETRVQLAELAADRGDADRVLEQPACVVVVAVGRAGQGAQPAADLGVLDKARDRGLQTGMGDLPGKELEEAVQLVRVAPHRRREAGGIGVRLGLDRADVELEAVAVTLDPPEHAHRVALAEAGIEQIDVVPDPALDPPARVDELEREVGGAALRAQAALARDGIDALDDAVLGQLGNGAHGASLGRKAADSLSVVAVVKPFRALRYDERRVGPLDALVAPPYDVISPEEREQYAARSPYNVVHVTLPEDEAQAARHLVEWEREGVLARDAGPALWWLAQDYTGPDGVARRRDGLVAALRVEPYETGVIRPHERTHAGPKEGRLRLLRATRTQVEPIFLLYEGALAGPQGDPAIDVELAGVRSRLWRVEGEAPPELADASLLIADGHHRYETALAFHEEEGTEASAWMPVVIVPTEQEGLTIFPTHRIVGRLDWIPELNDFDLADALKRIETQRDEWPHVVIYRRGGTGVIVGQQDQLDTELVDSFNPRDVRYTPSVDEARAAVDSGEAEAAFLLRAPTVEEVVSVARAGRTMPQKSTFFYPKLTSGLFFLPLD